MKNILLIIFICFLSTLSAQEIVDSKDIYFDNGLIYKVSDNQLFSGQVQKVRKNGHLVYEDYFKDGVWFDTDYFALLAREWKNHQRRA